MPELITCIPGYLGSAQEDGLEYLYEIRKRGATGMRIFLNGVWQLREGYEYASPYKIREWKLDRDIPEWDIWGSVRTPIFEHRWNDEYFDWLGKVLATMKKLGMKLHASFYDFCSWKLPGSSAYYGRTKAWNAWWQFRQEYGGFGIIHPNKQAWHREWLDKIIPFLNSTGIEYDVEICNEYYPQWIGFTEEEAVWWWNWMVDELSLRGVPLHKIYISADKTSDTIGFYSKLHYGYSCHHGVSSPKRYEAIDKFLNPPQFTFLSNDGGGYNAENTGPIGIYGRRETGIEDAKELAKLVLENKNPGFEFLSHSIDYAGEDMGCGPWGYLEALEEMGSIFKTTPEKISIIECGVSGKRPNPYCITQNVFYGWPWEAPTEECNICKPPGPPKPAKKSCWHYLKRLNFKAWWKCIWR